MTRREFLALTGASVLAACGAETIAENDDPFTVTLDAPLDRYFTTPDELAGRLDDERLRLLDLSPLSDYRAGHISGARHIWWQDTIERHNPVYGMLVNPDGQSHVIEQAGVVPESEVVCYDRAGGIYAARLVWMLHYMGFRDARVLSGGLQGWRTSGRGLTLQEPEPEQGGIPDQFDESILTNAGDILDRADHPGLIVLDTRTEGERRETWRGKLRLGKIPGSFWLPRDRFLMSGDVPALLDEQEIRGRLEAAGVDVNGLAEVLVYGLHGTLASLPYLGLTALDDFHVRLYDGSWADWGSREDLPIEPLP